MSRRSMTVNPSRESRQQLLEVCDHEAGSFASQLVVVAISRDSNHQSEAALLPGSHTGNGVLDDDRASGLDRELSGRGQEHVRLRLPEKPEIRSGLTVNTN